MAEIKDLTQNNELCVYEKYVAFWGSPLSNFYPSKFTLNKKEWHCVEQYFMWSKARIFEDEETAKLIEKATTPQECKKLGRKVKGFDEEVWGRYKELVMKDGLYAKFSQNEDLKAFLLSPRFEGKKFVEGSPYDGVWGVKVAFNDPSISDENNWNGENLLGKALDAVRQRIIDEKTNN